jgi:hypothetical protein
LIDIERNGFYHGGATWLDFRAAINTRLKLFMV